MIEPIVLGGGKRIFTDDGIARPLQLVKSVTTGTGVHGLGGLVAIARQ